MYQLRSLKSIAVFLLPCLFHSMMLSIVGANPVPTIAYPNCGEVVRIISHQFSMPVAIDTSANGQLHLSIDENLPKCFCRITTDQTNVVGFTSVDLFTVDGLTVATPGNYIVTAFSDDDTVRGTISNAELEGSGSIDSSEPQGYTEFIVGDLTLGQKTKLKVKEYEKCLSRSDLSIVLDDCDNAEEFRFEKVDIQDFKHLCS